MASSSAITGCSASARYFEQSYHIPLIVRDPRAAGRLQRAARTIDAVHRERRHHATMLEWLGIHAPHACDGRSLIPFLRSSAVPTAWRGEAHWDISISVIPRTIAPERALGIPAPRVHAQRDPGERYKYVHFAGLPPLLFDLHDDPNELRNRAADPAYLPVVLEYAQKMPVVADAATTIRR
jgi:arylsulfatase A-like enzyme